MYSHESLPILRVAIHTIQSAGIGYYVIYHIDKYAFRLSTKIYKRLDRGAHISNIDIKLLRDELAKVIGDNKRRIRAEEEQGKMIIALTLKVDQFALERDQTALERDQLSTKLEQANAKIDILVNMLKNKEQRPDPLLFSKLARPTFQASFRQVACSASHNNL